MNKFIRTTFGMRSKLLFQFEISLRKVCLLRISLVKDFTVVACVTISLILSDTRFSMKQIEIVKPWLGIFFMEIRKYFFFFVLHAVNIHKCTEFSDEFD